MNLKPELGGEEGREKFGMMGLKLCSIIDIGTTASFPPPESHVVLYYYLKPPHHPAKEKGREREVKTSALITF